MPAIELLVALVPRAAKHLLVLLLPHALPALLDQRTHKVGHAIGRGKACHARYRSGARIRDNHHQPVVPVRGRLMVGQRFLEPPVGVRILSPER